MADSATPFVPQDQATVSLAVTTTAGSRDFVPEVGLTRALMIYNAGSADVFCRVTPAGSTAIVPSGATAGGFPVPAGAVVIIGTSGKTLNALTAAGTATLYMTPGEGI